MKRATVTMRTKMAYAIISIHTLCEEGDYINGKCEFVTGDDFNPHPLWRGRHAFKFVRFSFVLFQSTPSVKRATVFSASAFWQLSNFNPHPLWRGRRGDLPSDVKGGVISIHTLCEEGDLILMIMMMMINKISIHTLCEEGDAIL